MQFRQHRGLLADSMTTLVHLDPTQDALSRHLCSLSGFARVNRTVRIEPYSGADDRIGWKETFVVLDDFGVVGFTDCMPIPIPF